MLKRWNRFFIFKNDLIILSMIVVITVIYLLSFMGLDLNSIFGNDVDARLNNYFLEHGYLYLKGIHSTFWNAPFFYPIKDAMTYSDNFLGTLPFYAFFRMFGYSIETSFQLWTIVMFLLNLISMYITTRLFNFSKLSSAIASLLFALNAFVMLKTVHIQLLPRFMVPIIFYGLVQFLTSFNVKYYYVFLFSFVYQMYIGIYIGFFVVMGLFLIVPLIVYKIYIHLKATYNDNKIMLRYYMQFFVSTTIAVILLGIIFAPYVLHKESVGGRSFNEVLTMLPRIESWFYTYNSFFKYLNSIGNNLPMSHEHIMFLGFGPYIALIMTSIYYFTKKTYFSKDIQKKILINFSFILIIGTFVFTIVFFDKYTLYEYTFFRLPGMDAIRAVTRVALFLLYPFSIVVAFLIDAILYDFHIKKYKKYIFLTCFVVYIAIEQYRLPQQLNVISKHKIQKKYITIFDKLKGKKNYDFFYYVGNQESSDEIIAMYVALLLNKPTINGYSGSDPINYGRKQSKTSLIHWIINNKKQFINKKILLFNSNSDSSEIIYANDIINHYSATRQKKPLNNFVADIKLQNISFDDNMYYIRVLVKNLSNETWSAFYTPKYGIALSYKLSNKTKTTGYSSKRYLLPKDIKPNETAIVTVSINKKQLSKGRNIIYISMVQELVAWFHDKQSKQLLVSINLH